MVVGLIPGVDVSIDGDIWPGSPYDRHIDVCPADGWAATAARDEVESTAPDELLGSTAQDHQNGDQDA